MEPPSVLLRGAVIACMLVIAQAPLLAQESAVSDASKLLSQGKSQYEKGLLSEAEAAGRVGVYKRPVVVSDYQGDNLRLNDIKLATSISPQVDPGPFTRHGLAIVPNPSRLYRTGQPVYLYYEIYNLNRDEQGKTQYQMRYEITPEDMPGRQSTRPDAQRKPSTILVFDGSGSTEEQPGHTSSP